MRVLILNQAYWPDVVATAQHMTDWAEYLAARGHQVTVIASRSVYGQTGVHLPRRETHHGVEIIRVGSNIFGKRGLISRALDFGLFHLRSLTRALLLPRQDVVVCLTTPPFIGLVGYMLRLLRRSRYVQYEMDVYPDVAVALGALRPGTLLARLLDRLHRRLLKSAARVVVLGRDMQALVESKNIPREKLVLVTPWAHPEEILPVEPAANAFRQEHGLQDRFVVMYSGNLGLGHDITTLVSAMQRLANDPQIRFVFIGGGKRMDEIQALAEKARIPAPLILDYQPRPRLGETLSAADVHLITQAPGTAGLIVPSKLYGILAAGRPAIYIGPSETEVARTLRENKLGYVLQIGDVDGLLAALTELRGGGANRDLHQRARAVLVAHHSTEVCCARLTEMVSGLEA